jgi:hypothetical protein
MRRMIARGVCSRPFAPAVLHTSHFNIVFAWCLPSLMAFLLFLLSFQPDSSVPFWPRWDVVTIYYSIWSLFVAPITTTIAIVLFIKRKRHGRMTPLSKLVVWTALGLSIVTDMFMLLAAYFP